MKIPKPVLTRWWTVGETASIAWTVYLLLLRICQQVINANGTTSKPNKIASGLQPLLLEAELFSDLTMIHEYHCYFVTPHFGWMESANDLTETPAFQAHNTLPRYYLLVEDLRQMKETFMTTHTFFENSRLALLTMAEEAAAAQKTKFHRFLDIAIEAIEKHFRRWCMKHLLPAALLSEYEIATVVAMVMTNKDWNDTLPDEYWSIVHAKTFRRSSYHAFVRERLLPTQEQQRFEAFALKAAELLLGGSEFRNKLNPDPFKHFLYSAYLPLPSNTQFVEAGVKEAKIVSCTDRSEPLRSAYAVNRSATIHNDKLSTLSTAERIQWLLETTKQHVDRQQLLREALPNYEDRYKTVTAIMRKDHYKNDRVQMLKDNASDKLHKNKKDNALQQKSGVDRTHSTEGLFPYGKLVKRLHFDALKVELLFRGCSEEELKDLTITQRKNKLRELEIARMDNNATVASKAFKPLSEALFPVA